MKNNISSLNTFITLWLTQSLSQLGSAMTGFALTLWLYAQTGSALKTALLSICTYAPYVLLSIFTGTLSDRFNKKKTMLVCDALAALSTVAVLVLWKTALLRPAHLYVLNALNGVMNTVQQPSGDVAMTLITPREHYQRASALRSFSQSLIGILNPMLAAAFFSFGGLGTVIAFDLFTFAAAFLVLLFFIRIPEPKNKPSGGRSSFLSDTRDGLAFLREHQLLLLLILFLAGINFVATGFDAALPALILPRNPGGQQVLGVVTACAGVATLAGSAVMTFLPPPRDRVRVISLSMLISLGTENFILAFSRSPVLWCAGQIIGWILVPVMNANLDVVMRSSIPPELQGRVYACRNSLQFFTIPLGMFLSGLVIDAWFEPWMARMPAGSLMCRLFGQGKGAGAALMLFVLGVLGTGYCLLFGSLLKKYRFPGRAEAKPSAPVE